MRKRDKMWDFVQGRMRRAQAERQNGRLFEIMSGVGLTCRGGFSVQDGRVHFKAQRKTVVGLALLCPDFFLQFWAFPNEQCFSWVFFK